MVTLESITTMIETWGTTATALGAIGAFGVGSWKYVGRPVASQVGEVHTFLTEALPALTSIANEFKPNGGGSLRDVIDRIEVSLAKNSAVATILLQESPDAIFMTDGDGNCTWVNDTYTKWTGIGVDQATGMGWHSAIAISDREMVFDEWDRAVKNKVSFTGHYTWTNGVHEFPVRCRTKLTFAKGKLVSAVGVVKRLD